MINNVGPALQRPSAALSSERRLLYGGVRRPRPEEEALLLLSTTLDASSALALPWSGSLTSAALALPKGLEDQFSFWTVQRSTSQHFRQRELLEAISLPAPYNIIKPNLSYFRLRYCQRFTLPEHRERL